MADEQQKPLWLHIYGQYIWHDDVQIVGNTDAIVALRDALTESLEKGEAQVNDVFAGDGEGYGVTVRVTDSEEWPRFMTPYAADYAQDSAFVDHIDPRYMGAP